MAQERKIGLDIVRAIAILLVLEQHGRYIIIMVFPWLAKLGLTDGVDVFFVLSGFLIGGILIKNAEGHEFDAWNFLVRRWMRTLPNFLMAFLVSFCVYVVYNKLYAINWSLVLKTLFFVQNYVPPFKDFSFFPEAWSLAIEEHFYLTMAVLLFLLPKLFRNKIAFAIIILSVVSIVYRILIVMHFGSMDYEHFNWYVRIIIPARFDSLLVGVSLAYFKFKAPKIFTNRIFVISCLLLGIVLCVIFDRAAIFSETLGFKEIVFSSLLFSIGVGLTFPFFDNLKLKRTIFSDAIQMISKLSYSAYLYHNFLFAIPMGVLAQDREARTRMYIYFIYWLFVAAVSYCSYMIVERPFLLRRDLKFPDKNQTIK